LSAFSHWCETTTSVFSARKTGVSWRPRKIAFPSRTIEYTGLQYLTGFALPNFYFHATTAYDILRHNGVDLGKRDFMGHT
jgi:hypothetical protein